MFNSTAEAVMDELAKVADGKTKIKMIHYMNRVTLDVIGKVCCHLIDGIFNVLVNIFDLTETRLFFSVTGFLPYSLNLFLFPFIKQYLGGI